MRVKKGIILALVLIFVVSMAFAGGGIQQSNEKTTVHYWTWRPEDIDAYEGLLKVFKSQNPDIEVVQNAYKTEEYNTIMSAALGGNSGPDVLMCKPYGGIEVFVESGYLEPLDDLVPELKGFSEGSRMSVTSISNGKMYGVPFASQTNFIFYNQDIYAKLGLIVPKTWDQFKANCEAIKKAGIIPIANGGQTAWRLEVLMGTISPNFYGANNFYNKVIKGETNFQDPVFVSAIDRLNELKPYFPDMFMGVNYDDDRALFSNEQAAHYVSGSYDAVFFTSQNPSLKYDIFAPPAPSSNEPNYVSMYEDGGFSMNSASTKKDAAAKLLRFFASKTTGDFFIKDLKFISPVPGVDTSSDPFLAKVISLQQYNTPYIFLVGFRYEQPTGSMLAAAALQGMFSGQITAAEVCKQIQDGIATYYKPFQK